MKKSQIQTRRVKQEAIDNSLLLLNGKLDSFFSEAPACQTPSVAKPGLPAPSDLVSAVASTSNTVKREEPQENQTLQELWEPLRSRLWELWREIPAVPSLKSRTAWAKAKGIPGHKVHSWYKTRKEDRKRHGTTPHPEDGYDLVAREQPSTCNVDDSMQVPRNSVMASSSVPPSPPQTPVRLDSPSAHVQIAGSSPQLGLNLVRPILMISADTPQLPRDLEQTIDKASSSDMPTNATSVTNPVAEGVVIKGAKRGRKRKVKVEEVNSNLEGADNKAVPAPKKRQRAIKPKVMEAGITPPTINVDEDHDMKNINLSLAPGTPNNHTVPSHSTLARIYTSVLVAPFVLGENAGRDTVSSKDTPPNGFASVHDLFIANPSPYIVQPLPPLPAFEALGHGSFINDCREALRTSLKINSDIGLWDLVVESLPPSYFMDIGKDLDIEWPEIDWP
ncbi:hypothetical protein RhiJN_08470 [Ceratobasidium sp. AG-Ba]|nr:hypothetical protein RhiJN_08470 [Ceratobasidium sp. AG-Ba]QRW09255.1 hypothetical protein RhiLY_08254 [Ceratobasidium sp. AG-Ba]